MSQKPIHVYAAENNGKAYGRQAMWEAIRSKGTFFIVDISLASKREKSSVRTYVMHLIAAGIVEDTGIRKKLPRLANLSPSNDSRYSHKVYRLARDIGHEAPRLNADGTFRIESRDQMWLAMKILGSFTYMDLAAHASTDICHVDPADTRDYCKHLCKAGYLRVLHKATNNNKALYTLLPSMNTGPHAPKVQRTKLVFDPNRNQIMWHEEIEP